MKKGSYILISLGVMIVIFFIVNNKIKNLITSEYTNGQIITQLNIKDTDNIQSIEFRYETSFLEQYTNVNPECIIAEYTTFEMPWPSLYPYDLEGNKVFYESKDGGLNLVDNGEVPEITKSSQEKYNQMKMRIPDIKFIMGANF